MASPSFARLDYAMGFPKSMVRHIRATTVAAADQHLAPVSYCTDQPRLFIAANENSAETVAHIEPSARGLIVG